MGFAKRLARCVLCNVSLDVEAGECHPHLTGFPCWISHVRMTWPTQTLIPTCGGASYYVWRTIATATDDLYPSEFPVKFISDAKNIIGLTMESGDKSHKVLATWNPDMFVDGIAEVKSDVSLPGLSARRVVVIDTFNGTEQELNFTQDKEGVLLKGMLIKDYPALIRIIK